MGEKIPELATGKDHKSYSLSMANLTTHIHDTHTELVDKFRVMEDYLGAYIPSFTAVNIGNKWVVEKTLPEDSIKAGDTILSVNGESIEKRIKRCRKYLSVSIDNRYWYAFTNLLGSNTIKAKFKVLRDRFYCSPDDAWAGKYYRPACPLPDSGKGTARMPLQ